MINDANEGKQEYKRHVNYDYPKKDQITSILHGDFRATPFHILTHINLDMSENGILIAPEIEIAEIRIRVSQILRPGKKRRRAQPHTTVTDGATDDDII